MNPCLLAPSVIPAQAGIQGNRQWIPAFAGKTDDLYRAGYRELTRASSYQ